MSNGYLVAANADVEVAHNIADGFGLDLIDAATVGDPAATGAALAQAANIGVILSASALQDSAFIALLRSVANNVARVQLIAASPDLRGALPFLPESWPLMSLDDATSRADHARRQRGELEGEGQPRAHPLPPTEAEAEAEPDPQPQYVENEEIAPPVADEPVPELEGAPLDDAIAPDEHVAEEHTPEEPPAAAEEPAEDPTPALEGAPEDDGAVDDLNTETITPEEPEAFGAPSEQETATPEPEPELVVDVEPEPEPIIEPEDEAPLLGGVSRDDDEPEERARAITIDRDEAPSSDKAAEPPPPPASAEPPPPPEFEEPPAQAAPPPAGAAPAPRAAAPEPARKRVAPPSAPADATAFAPKKLRRSTPELVRIVLHQPKDLQAVIKAARKIDERTDPAPSGMSVGEVALGATVGVALEVRGAACDGTLQRRVWQGEPIDFSFSVEADASVKQVVILARVFINDAQIGVLAFPRNVSGPSKKPASPGDRVRLKRHKRVFLSYSSKDRETVSAIATAYEMAGVEHFWDRASLKSGEEWHPRLRREIDRADLFHLCWSKAAADSEWVRKEAEHALTRRRRNSGKPDITVQMLDGPPWAPHPPELDIINFDDFVRAAIVGYARGDGST